MGKRITEMTLRELYEEYEAELNIFGKWIPSTCKLYKNNYLNILAPQLNDKPFLDYEMSDFEAVLMRIMENGYERDRGKRKVRYSEGTIGTLRANLRRMDEFLVKEKHARKISLFWGTKQLLDSTLSEEEIREKERTQLRKSLNHLEEKKVYEQVMLNPKQDGEYFGIALMAALGLRNSEACAAKFSNIVPIEGYPDSYVLQVIQNIKTGEKGITVGGKTKNVFRLIPIPDNLYHLIKKREEYIRTHYSGDKNVSNLTIACIGHNFEQHCQSKDLTETGKFVLQSAGVSSFVLGQIDQEIEFDDTVKEKNPTAYLFRRNFATMLYILGLTQNEIEYIMGHRIESNIDSRNSFSNPDKLYPIKCKMDNRPLFSSHYPLTDPIKIIPGELNHFSNSYEQKFIIPESTDPCTVIIDVQANAPSTGINIGIKSSPENETVQYRVRGSMSPRKHLRISSILKKVHHVYSSKRGKSLIESKATDERDDEQIYG